MRKRIRYLLLLGALASSPTFAQTYINVESNEGIDSYVLDDVETLKFTSSDLNVTNASGMTPYAMSDVRKIYFSNSVGVDEKDPESNVHLFPNPTTGYVSLNFEQKASEMVTVDIYDMLGARVFTKVFAPTNGDLNIRLNLSDYINGIYIVRINSGETVVSKRVIKH